MRIVFASHTFINPELVVGSHHLARHLAAMGHEVLHLSTPVTAGHMAGSSNSYRQRIRLWKSGGRAVAERLWEYVPFTLVPWTVARRAAGATFNPYLTFFPGLGSRIGTFPLSDIDALILDEPRFIGLERRLRPRTILYRATDLYAEMKQDCSILEMERLLVEKADGIAATSEPVLRHLRQWSGGKPSLLLENGADVEHFSTPQSEPPEYASLPHPRAVYAGALDDRFDFETVLSLVQSAPDLSIILIGPLTRTLPEGLQNHPRVLLTGPRPYASLPAYLQHADVGLLPLNDHPANSGRSPMKLYEYAAAGLPVLARGTDELHRRNESFVHLYDRPDQAAGKIREALAQPRDRAREAARTHGWRAKAENLISFLKTLSSDRMPSC